MGKRKDVENAAPASDAVAAEKSVEAVQALAVSLANEPAAELKIEPKLDDADIAAAKSETPAVEAAAGASAIEPVKPTLTIETVKPADRPIIEDIPVAPLAAGDDDAMVADAPPPARESKFMLLAASVALAAAFGAMVGALGAYGIAGTTAPGESAAASGAENFAVQEAVAKLRSEIAALKSSIDAANSSSKTQSTKITERFDRLDRAQAEPAGKLTKAVETLERIEKRTDASTAAKETTGSVPQATPASAAPQPPQPPVVQGWILRDVRRGTAIIQGARYGMIEVEAGDLVPGLGRIESIRKQDGRWVVVTSRGLVTMR